MKNAPLTESPGKLEDVLEGVIDVGSNSLRTSVYLRRGWALFPVHVSKIFSRLGHDPENKGRLYEPGVRRSLLALERFAQSARTLGVTRFHGVASAAVRNSTDGEDFLCLVRENTGLPVRIVDGEEEARLAALGLLYNIPDAKGVVADMGGGSLELASVRQGWVHERASLPIGSLNMAKLCRREKIAMLKPFDWLSILKGGSLYAVGGVWRALARFHIHISASPVSAPNCYRLSSAEARALAFFLSDCTIDLLEQFGKEARIPERRWRALPGAARVLALLLEKSASELVVFSNYGLREGVLLADITSDFNSATSWLKKDLLLETLFAFTSPAGRKNAEKTWKEIRPSVTSLSERLGFAAALLAFGEEGKESLFPPKSKEWILNYNLPGISHEERAFLALTLVHCQIGVAYPARHCSLIGKTGIESWHVAMKLGSLLRDAGKPHFHYSH